jgi:hypothetical protein
MKKKLPVKLLIRCAHLGLKSIFFIWGFKINLQKKKQGIAKGKHGTGRKYFLILLV